MNTLRLLLLLLLANAARSIDNSSAIYDDMGNLINVEEWTNLSNPYNTSGLIQCNGHNEWIAGFYRIKSLGYHENINHLQKILCRSPPGSYSQSGIQIFNADWEEALYEHNVSVSCPKGYFLNGIFKVRKVDLFYMTFSTQDAPSQTITLNTMEIAMRDRHSIVWIMKTIVRVVQAISSPQYIRVNASF